VQPLTASELALLFGALGLLLATARVLGALARALRQPPITGELLAGVVLGPTVLGLALPGRGAVVLDGVTSLGAAIFLLVAGLEVATPRPDRQGGIVAATAATGFLVPFAVGYAVAGWAPERLGYEAGDPVVFALFVGTALSISALPVIVRILFDLGLQDSDVGRIVVGTAVLIDLAGWSVAASLLGALDGRADGPAAIARSVALAVILAGVLLTGGRWLLRGGLRWLGARGRLPDDEALGLLLAVALLGAACAEWLGLHAFFGAYLVGAAVGASRDLPPGARAALTRFAGCVLAPIFFASMGLKVDFVRGLDLPLLALVLSLACATKIGGCLLGGRLAGTPPRQAWAVSVGLNARGAMEIVVAQLALQHGLIGERLFVALVLTALLTSMVSGPLLRLLLRQPRREALGAGLAVARPW
jgi:Kef-type K+ transport system membrane component KefB